MFIKWRTYQRQQDGKKGDKYIQQPIIVQSFRVGKKRLREELGKDKADLIYERLPKEAFKRVQMPRHEVIYKLPSYPMCMVVYYRNPQYMVQRLHWWQHVDTMLHKLAEARSDMTEETIKKLKDDIERVVPRITAAEEEKLKVVLNDLPLHFETSS